MHIASRLVVAAATATLVLAAPASAQVTFSGFTNGCFYTVSACTPETTPGARTDVIGPLTYTNSTFSVTSFASVAAIGETAATPNVNNLGSISLPNAPLTFDFTNQRFLLNVYFSAPNSTSPTNTNYMAQLSGAVLNNGGAVNFDFDNTPQTFLFNGGSFSLHVNDVSLTNTGGPNTIAVSGFITVKETAVPEPTSSLLMAGGLAGLAFFGKRRRNNAA
ncbi:PEP-CTERM sorting domain-containing protein [Gemmatimonas sp.]|jgi:hypothetical protein|uniref:PEP-CTERM sorting domain-containing protein n=1 Tax=Gemmatimonas sp. TaxID=1962908 RepID=UPI0037C02880